MRIVDYEIIDPVVEHDCQYIPRCHRVARYAIVYGCFCKVIRHRLLCADHMEIFRESLTRTKCPGCFRIWPEVICEFL